MNVRLSPEQIAYTIDHAGASTLLVYDEFVALLEGLKDRLPKVKRLQMLLDAAAKASVDLKGLKMVIGGSALPKALAKRALAADNLH